MTQIRKTILFFDLYQWTENIGSYTMKHKVGYYTFLLMNRIGGKVMFFAPVIIGFLYTKYGLLPCSNFFIESGFNYVSFPVKCISWKQKTKNWDIFGSISYYRTFTYSLIWTNNVSLKLVFSPALEEFF